MRASSVPDLGDLDLRPGDGLIGWAGGSARTRRAASDLLVWSLGLPVVAEGGRPPWTGRPGPASAAVELSVGDASLEVRDREITVTGEPGEARRPEDLLGVRPEGLSLAWAGGPGAGPARILARGARLLASLRGLDRLESGLERLGEEVEGGGGVEAGEPDPEERARLEAELGEVEERLASLADVPERLRSLEERLRSLRADAAEVAGDLEEETMEWLRERQDAETHLQTYRDRARELRDRIRELEESGPDGTCPFCRRSLGDHFEDVMAELRDEWERLVQDGSWWRRRREQLELKPAGVRELEGRSVRLQAAVEECAERLERSRFELRERDELRSRRREILGTLGRDGAPRPDGERDGGSRLGERRRWTLVTAFRVARTELLDEDRERLARLAGTFLNRISGGRILGLISSADGEPILLEDGRTVPAPTEEDRAATTVALRLALAVRMVEEGVPLDSILLDEPVRNLDAEARLRTVRLLRGVLDRIPQILLLAGDEAVDASPESFDRIVELRGDGSGPRSVGGGVGGIRLRTG